MQKELNKENEESEMNRFYAEGINFSFASKLFLDSLFARLGILSPLVTSFNNRIQRYKEQYVLSRKDLISLFLPQLFIDYYDFCS